MKIAIRFPSVLTLESPDSMVASSEWRQQTFKKCNSSWWHWNTFIFSWSARLLYQPRFDLQNFSKSWLFRSISLNTLDTFHTCTKSILISQLNRRMEIICPGDKCLLVSQMAASDNDPIRNFSSQEIHRCRYTFYSNLNIAEWTGFSVSLRAAKHRK